MKGWTRHRGTAVSLARENVDTDQIIPARFMSTPRAEGYGRFLLHDLRRDGDGKPDPSMPLNAHPDASVLVAGRNFGSGSSREAAVYALVDFGIRAVLAPGFGDIFAGNAVNNGLLAARISEDDAEALHGMLAGGPATVEIDLDEASIEADGRTIGFEIDDTARTKLIKGWDDIDLTRAHADDIRAHAASLRETRAWMRPRERDGSREGLGKGQGAPQGEMRRPADLATPSPKGEPQ